MTIKNTNNTSFLNSLSWYIVSSTLSKDSYNLLLREQMFYALFNKNKKERLGKNITHLVGIIFQISKPLSDWTIYTYNFKFYSFYFLILRKYQTPEECP